MIGTLTIAEVCAILRIGDRTAYELCRTGRLGGAVKVGGQWRVDKAEFLKWFKAGGTTARPKKAARRR